MNVSGIHFMRYLGRYLGLGSDQAPPLTHRGRHPRRKTARGARHRVNPPGSKRVRIFGA